MTTQPTVDTTKCAHCDQPPTTTRPTGVSNYFAPRPEDPVVLLCEPCALALDRDVRDIHLDWAQEW